MPGVPPAYTRLPLMRAGKTDFGSLLLCRVVYLAKLQDGRCWENEEAASSRQVSKGDACLRLSLRRSPRRNNILHRHRPHASAHLRLSLCTMVPNLREVLPATVDLLLLQLAPRDEGQVLLSRSQKQNLPSMPGGNSLVWLSSSINSSSRSEEE